MLFFILFSAFAAKLAQAVAPPIPNPTDPLVDGAHSLGFTPKPTEAPGLSFDLRKRSGVTSGQFLGWFAPDNTCGYVSGSIGASKTCDLTQLCAALEVNNAATLGCCDTLDAACTWFGTCIDYNGYWSSSLCDQACQNDVNTVLCNEADYPYCYSFTIPPIGATYYSCASTAYSKFVTFQTTYAGENDGRTWSKVYASGSSTGYSFPVGTPIPGGSGSTTTPVSAATTTPSPAPSKDAPIGIIVGGVVGGLAIIGLIAAVLVFLLLRRRKPTNVAPVTNFGAAAAGPGPAQGPAPNMTEQQATQSMYGVPTSYQPQQDGAAAEYYNGGKQDYPPNGQQGGMAKFGGPLVSQQEVKPPTSPAPPYSHPVPQQNTGISAIGGPPPNAQGGGPGMNNFPFQQQPQVGGVQSMGGPPGTGVVPAGGPPHAMQQNDVQELPVQFATTMHNAQGEPIFEAPDQAYRGA